MNCNISDAQWTEYVDRALPVTERRTIEAHLRVCASCRAELEIWQEIDQRLRIECGLLAESLDVPARAAAQERILAVLEAAAGASENRTVRERLWRVRWVLALLCGPNTAARIIEVTESHTGIVANVEPNERGWPMFLGRLSLLTTEMCGSSAGELIWAVGK
jgi:anti-sigma factor RsiW